MHRVMRGENGVIVSPQQRLSVGFGTSSSVQIHATATPTNLLIRSGSPLVGTPPDCPIPTNVPDVKTPSSRQMSMHENLLLRILSTPSDRPVLRQGSFDETPSQRTADDSFDSCLSGSNTPTLDLLTATPDAMRCHTPPAAEGILPNRHLQMLYRDLNSPSATARLRALRALKSPTKRNAYGNFDVSYAEQDIITAEERMQPEKRDIREVLADVCVYVEVRSGTDNRSDGIKEHVASLGAKVNDRLLKDTTHVIFKDGLLSTYQKAKKMNIPVVSVLWIEACKRHMCLMNPDNFKISNVERYENPDLFKRIRRQKSMQPGAEETVGNKKRAALTTKAIKATTVISPPSKLPVLHRIRKDDRLERILNDFEAVNQIANANTGPVDEYDEMLHAAPMRMLERFRSTPTRLDNNTDEMARSELADDDGRSTPKGCFNITHEYHTPLEMPASGSKKLSASGRTRRRTILFTPQMMNVQEEIVVSSTLTDPSGEETATEQVALDGCNPVVGKDKGTSLNMPEHSSGRKPRGRRKTLLVGKNEESSDSIARTPTVRTRRSSMVTGNDVRTHSNQLQHEESVETIPDPRTTRRRTTIVASKENISPSVLRTPTADGKKSRSTTASGTRSRRKTVAFGIDENTPPTGALVSLLAEAKAHSNAKRGTIYSPKEMDVSTVARESAKGSGPTALTKVDSKGSEVMSISSRLGKTPTAANRRRRTLFNPLAMEEASRVTSEKEFTAVIIASESDNVSERRQTLFTPGNSTFMEPLEVSETPPEASRAHSVNGSSICNRPDPTSSSTPNPSVGMASGSQVRRKTLLQEYEDTLLFSSTRAPERRRRTIFDISMDIMDHRLSEINRQAAAAKKQSGGENPVIAPKRPVDSTSPGEGLQKSIDHFYRKAIRSSEKSNKSSSSESSSRVVDNPITAPPRKRKLFNVQSSEEHPSSKTAAVKSNVRRSPAAATSIGTTKELPPSVPASNTTIAKRRRTTTFFEPPVTKQAEGRVTKKKQQFPVGRGLPTMASQYNNGPYQLQAEQERQHLATTNLHTEQATFVKEAIHELDGFILQSDVTDQTTHLVTLEPRRTINMLRALVRGLWIVRYDWIVESFRARRWLPEEQFEVRDFSPAVPINRSERQAFGSQYGSELFADYGPFWISPHCDVPARQLRELVLLCRGKVTGSKLKAKYLILGNGEEDTQHSGENANHEQIGVTAHWILDSITANKVKKLSSIASPEFLSPAVHED